MTNRCRICTKPVSYDELNVTVTADSGGFVHSACKGAEIVARTADVAAVGFFLYFAEQDNQMYGSHHAGEALDSFCRLVAINPAEFRAKAAKLAEGG